MPPTRIMRYCCEHLKEHGGEGRFVVTGVRWAESSRRKNTRAEVEINYKNCRSKKAMNQKQVFINSDNDAKRRIMESCTIQSKFVLNPIIDWEDEEVWEFILENNLPYCKLYDEGFKRLGCIGCPMSRQKNIVKDFERWPGFKMRYLKAFKKMIEARRKCGLTENVCWETPDDVMNWWIYGKTK